MASSSSASTSVAVAAPAKATELPDHLPWDQPSRMHPVIVRLPAAWPLSDEAMLKLWELNPQWDLEVTEEGALSIMPGTGRRNSSNAVEIAADVINWRRAGGGGEVYGADGMVRFPPPSRAMSAPDVSWVSDERYAEPIEQHDTLLIPVCPDFVVELRSLSDYVEDQQEKMERWMGYGVRLGWLIDVYGGQAWIYREGQEQPEMREQPDQLDGEDVLPGLVVDLSRIWG